MRVFPQISTGAMAQYPIRRRRSERAILNLSEDGTVIALWDESASQVKWDLRFSGLTDQETANITSFYEMCEGPLQPFLFLDPAANLFTYSEDFTQPVWQESTLLSLAPGITDPYNTSRATGVTNNSLADLSLTQTSAIPGSVTCAFSVYARSDQPTTLVLTRTDGSTVESLSIQLSAVWTRYSLNTSFASSISLSCDFSAALGPGQTVDLFGFQLEPQPLPGLYVMSAASAGIYPNSRFDAQQITAISTGPGESSLAVSILSPSTQ